MTRTMTSTHLPAIRAFLNGKSCVAENTESVDGKRLTLYGHTIATMDDNGQFVTLHIPADWNTPTTRRRLNALLNELHPGYPSRVSNKDFVPFLQGRAFSEVYCGGWFAIVDVHTGNRIG